MNTDPEVAEALECLNRTLESPRTLARKAVQRRREKSAAYNFETAPKELKRVMYGGVVRFKRRSLLSRLLLWWR